MSTQRRRSRPRVGTDVDRRCSATPTRDVRGEGTRRRSDCRAVRLRDARPGRRAVTTRDRAAPRVTRSELSLVYQPRIDLRSGALVGFEALVRWQRPGERTVLPEEFIPIAEAPGLIDSIGGWVLDSAVGSSRAGTPCSRRQSINLSINVSARQLEPTRPRRAPRRAHADM